MRKEERLEIANKVLASFPIGAPARLSLQHGKIAVSWTQTWKPNKPVITKTWITKGNDFYPLRHRQAPQQISNRLKTRAFPISVLLGPGPTKFMEILGASLAS